MFMNFHEEFLHLKFFTLSADSEMIEFTLGALFAAHGP